MIHNRVLLVRLGKTQCLVHPRPNNCARHAQRVRLTLSTRFLKSHITHIYCISKSQVRRTGWSSYVSAERIPWCASMLLNMKPSSISVTTKANAIVPLHGPGWNLSKVAKVTVVVAKKQRLARREAMVVDRCTRSAAPIAALDCHWIRRQPGSRTSRRRSFRAGCQGGLHVDSRASHRERISS